MAKKQNALKRKRYAEKILRNESIEEKKKQQMEWIKMNSSFCRHVSITDIEEMTHSDEELGQLLKPYMNLKDGVRIIDGIKIFIAEGTETVRLLMQRCQGIQGKKDIEDDGTMTVFTKLLSILVKPSTFFEKPVKLLDELQTGDAQDPTFNVLIGSEVALSNVAGFPISRGAMACGVVPDELDTNKFDQLLSGEAIRILAMDGICDSANMGSMIRSAAAFGINLILLSKDCCDPWYRRSVRVSMGYICAVSFMRTNDLSGTLTQIRQKGVYTYAAVIEEEALVMSSVANVPKKWCCVVGNEGRGVSPEVRGRCAIGLRIGMAKGVDSLSVPVATGILLHGLTEREQKQEH